MLLWASRASFAGQRVTESGSVAGSGAQPLLDNNHHDQNHNHNHNHNQDHNRDHNHDHGHNIIASRIPAAQPEGSLSVVLILLLLACSSA